MRASSRQGEQAWVALRHFSRNFAPWIPEKLMRQVIVDETPDNLSLQSGADLALSFDWQDLASTAAGIEKKLEGGSWKNPSPLLFSTRFHR
jgi:hypothetical protein